MTASKLESYTLISQIAEPFALSRKQTNAVASPKCSYERSFCKWNLAEGSKLFTNIMLVIKPRYFMYLKRGFPFLRVVYRKIDKRFILFCVDCVHRAQGFKLQLVLNVKISTLQIMRLVEKCLSNTQRVCKWCVQLQVVSHHCCRVECEQIFSPKYGCFQPKIVRTV